VKTDLGNPAAWISFAYAVRRAEDIEAAEAILLKARASHPKSALIAFNLACYASVAGHMEEAKARLQHAINLDKNIRSMALDDEDLRSLWDWIGRIS
jgi:Flp pilus assembly protein TadD